MGGRLRLRCVFLVTAASTVLVLLTLIGSSSDLATFALPAGVSFTPFSPPTSLTSTPAVNNEPEWVSLGRSIARVWNTSHGLDWCVPQHNEHYASRFLQRARDIPKMVRPFVQGLIYVKSPKTASSTGAGISLQMAHRVAERKFGRTNNNTNGTEARLCCTVNYTHPFAFHKGHGKRISPSLLWTHVRHPVKQGISLFFHFLVTRKGQEPTTSNLLKCMDSLKHAQTSYLSPINKPFNLGDGTPPSIVSKILGLYDFIAVADRMDESLVVMKMLFGLAHGDLIVLPSKQAGEYYYSPGAKKKGKQSLCEKSILPFPLNGTDEYIANEHPKNNLDYLLFSAVNHSLDLTIDALGRNEFARELAEFRRLSHTVQEKCNMESPCTEDGVLRPKFAAQQECYADDAGCGHTCVNRVLSEIEEQKN